MPPVIRNVRASPAPEGVCTLDDVATTWFRPALGAVLAERPGSRLGSTHPCLFDKPVATNSQLPAQARFDDLPHPPANKVARSR